MKKAISAIAYFSIAVFSQTDNPFDPFALPAEPLPVEAPPAEPLPAEPSPFVEVLPVEAPPAEPQPVVEAPPVEPVPVKAPPVVEAPAAEPVPVKAPAVVEAPPFAEAEPVPVEAPPAEPQPEEGIIIPILAQVASMPAEERSKENIMDIFLSTFLERTQLGIRFGYSFPSMSYSNENLDGYSSVTYKKSMFELFGEYDLTSSISVRPGLKFVTRGQHIEDANFTYEFDAKYTEITIPVVYTFQPYNNIMPYALGGPVLGIARGGDISYSQGNGTAYTPYETEIGKGNISPYAFGLYLGAGVKYPFTIKDFPTIPGFEIGYHLGLTDTYSDDEHSGFSKVMNPSSSKVSGTRKHRGFEIEIRLSIPLGNFKKSGEQATEPEAPPPPVPEPEPEKVCYTIDEMKDLIRTKKNIQGKKICAIKQVSFGLGKRALTAEDKVYLDEMVILMQTNDLIKVRVNGHTDNVGGDETNLYLSRDRAKAVYDYLKSKGIDPSRLSFAFFGSTRPIADNDTEEGRAINRRVEFEITNQ